MLCSSKVQQRHRANATAADPHEPAGLWHRPPVAALPPDGKEKVQRLRQTNSTGASARICLIIA